MKLNLKQKGMDLLVHLFLKVMRSAVKRWRQRNEKQDTSLQLAGVPSNPSPATPDTKQVLMMLAVDVLLELTRLLLDQAQNHVNELEQ